MANVLMMRYAATRGNGHEDERGLSNDRMPGETHRDGEWNGRMNRYDRPGMINTAPDIPQYGRLRSGTRRSEYDPVDRRMGEDEEKDEKGRKYKIEVLPSNVIQWPYTAAGGRSGEDYRSSRQIGFGATNNMDRQEHERTESTGHIMQEDQPTEFDRETAEHWVRSMRNEDRSHPSGGKWSADMLKPLAQKYGIPTEGKRFWEFYAMTNAMYSDYGEVARKFGITSPEFYACMAKAWLDDKDALPDKTALYYEYIVAK